jgi:hypothetical protein
MPVRFQAVLVRCYFHFLAVFSHNEKSVCGGRFDRLIVIVFLALVHSLRRKKCGILYYIYRVFLAKCMPINSVWQVQGLRPVIPIVVQ